jgi:S-adenosylmethionine decarboxylase proenzyme
MGVTGERPPPPNPLPHAVGEGEKEGKDGSDGELILTKPSRELILRARELRRTATSAEQLLWDLLRRRQIHGRSFRRQHPLGRFIADFFCDDARLIIEVDGAVHLEPTQQERDRSREEILRANDLSVLRFTNNDVFNQTEKVLEAISDFVLTHTHGTRKHHHRSDTPPPPQRGGGGWGEGAAPIGHHALLDLYDVPAALLTDAEHLGKALTDAALAAGMTPLSAPVLHRFPGRTGRSGGGLTGFLPLAESHIALHSYPEWGYLAADVFTCGACPPEAAVAVLQAALRPGRACVRVLRRGEEVRRG